MNRRKSCARKQRFATLKEAQAAASNMARNKAAKGNPVVSFLRAYGCECGGFHYGNTKQIDWDLVATITNRTQK